MARPSKYETEVKDKLILVEGWARDGLTNELIAEKLGITVKTLYEWQNKYSDFRDALKKGKEVVDREVENALLKRALGYRYEEVTIEPREVMDEFTGRFETREVVTKRVIKEVQPDTTAQIFWLKNRKPADWRDKQNIEHSGPGGDEPVKVIFNIPRPGMTEGKE